MTASADGPASRLLPDPRVLTWDQSAGRACIWCKKALTTGTVSVGFIRDRLGAHNLDTEVWAGPCCLGEET
ncbi:hypothetical protein GCM10010207_63340 [Streptomyces atratus]|nr:hypothetical protein GCM10010207_63340 [Streptomyces atratus]